MKVRDGAEFCFPQMLNMSCRKPTFYFTKAVFLNILLSIVSIITVVLNLLVIISISHFRQLHSPTNIILLSLAVSDFLVGLLLMPLEIYRNTSCWFLGEVICAVYYYLACYIPFVSIGHIVFISIDRFVAICYPMHYPTRITAVRVNTCLLLCWLWYAFYSMFYIKDKLIQLFNPKSNDSCLGQCSISIDFAIGVVDLILTFILPVMAIVVLYMRVFVVAVYQAHSMRSHVTFVSGQHPVKVKVKKSELKAARTLGVLVITYLSCFCPFYIYSLIEVKLTSTSYAYFLFVVYYFNSCINPLIYTFSSLWFRKAIRIIITLQILKPGSCETNVL